MRISDWSSDVCSSDLRGKGRETAEDPDADEQPRGFAAIATPRECADEQAHQQATGDIDRQRLPRETGAEPREHTLSDEMARTGADRASEHAGKQAVHGFPLARSEVQTSELQSLIRISKAD